MHFENYLGLANRATSLLLLLLIRYFDLGFLAVFATFAITNIITLSVGLVIVRHKFFRPRLVWQGQLLWFWFKEALPIAISFMTLETFLRVDILVLRIFRDPVEIAFFDVAYKVIYRLIGIFSIIAIVLSPVMARLGETDLSRLRALVEQCLKYLFILAIPLTVATHILGPQLIVPLFGVKFKPGELSMSILSLCLFFAFFEPILIGTLISIKKTWAVFIANGLALGTNLLLDLILIPRYGFVGASYANIGAYAFLFIFSVVISNYYLGGLSLTRITGRALPIGLGVLPIILLYHAQAPNIAISPFVLASLVVIGFLTIYVVLLYFARVLNWEEFIRFKEIIRPRQV